MIRLPHFLVCLSIIAASAAAQPELPIQRVPPTEPAEAEKTFRVMDGFRMQLIAAEPLVTDPVAMAYDEDGRAYVVEMNDYPYTDKGTHQPWKDNTTDAPAGRVRLLIDADGDGKFDRSTVFADRLSWPTGVACWKRGVFVTATPDIWYLKDTDGDGVADVRRKVFTGFRKYNVQAVINNLVWGSDNQLYAAGATNGANVIKVDDPNPRPIPMLRNDFRIDPRTEAFEVLSGGARFGNAFDDDGNRFLCNIRNPAQHVVIEHRYFKTNQHLPVPSALQDVAEAGDALPVYRISPPELWRDVRARRWAGDRTVAMPRSELVAGGVVTSSSGVTIYRGGAYPREFREQFFLGEVANNLVHRQRLSPAGASFSSQRIDEKVEFVASTDVWFRPTNFVNAPDGTLHVLDMYREVIEHPWSIPDDIHEKLDLRSGHDRGRIYRLAPAGFKVPPPPRLGAASIEGIVAALAHSSSWWRETAQRLLVERQDAAAIPLLRELLHKSEAPLARLHALWTLHGMGALREVDLLRGLGDGEPGVRENALRASESKFADAVGVRDRVFALAGDKSPRVRFQAALTLSLTAGSSPDPRLADALYRILRTDIADRWTRTAVLIAAANCGDAVLVRVLSDREPLATGDIRLAIRQLAGMIGARGREDELKRSLHALAGHGNADTRQAAIEGLGEGLRRSRKTLRQVAGGVETPVGRMVTGAFEAATEDAVSDGAPLAQRLDAIRLLAFDDYARVAAVVPRLLSARQPQEVQRGAVAAIAAFNHGDVGSLLLRGWRAYTPPVRGDVINAMLGYKNRLMVLFDAIEAGTVAASYVPATRRTTLLQHADAEIRERAIKVFGNQGGTASRKAVVGQYRPALDLKGNAAGGRKVFETVCATCHRVGQDTIGNDVGPNLATVRSWTVEQLLTNILDPNREVAPQFVEYVLELDGGENLSGLIADETAGSFTLVQSGGQRTTVLRSGIRRMFSSGLSLMPESLEQGLSVQQLADLIEYIRTGG